MHSTIISSLLAAAAIGHPPGTPRWRRRRAKFLIRAAWQRESTRVWVRRLAESDLQPIWLTRPRLGSKLQRPYLCRDWGVAERVGALTDHYDILRELFSAASRAAIYRDGIAILRLAGKSGRTVDLRLAYKDQFEKEGELTLAVEDTQSGLTLAGVTFCITGPAIWIGGLQASPDPRTRGLIHDVVKEMHGMRPKALALWALRELAQVWGIAQLRAIADSEHIYRHWRKRRAFAAVYDEFWAESGGTRHPEGGWELPLAVAARPRSEIKPSRRKAHELRYAMLADLAPELRSVYRALADGAPAADPRSFSY